jgi:hypothetical protein
VCNIQWKLTTTKPSAPSRKARGLTEPDDPWRRLRSCCIFEIKHVVKKSKIFFEVRKTTGKFTKTVLEKDKKEWNTLLKL